MPRPPAQHEHAWFIVLARAKNYLAGSRIMIDVAITNTMIRHSVALSSRQALAPSPPSHGRTVAGFDRDCLLLRIMRLHRPAGAP
jgi:hypothetical protein